MIERSLDAAACERFQNIAWDWLQSGEITRTNNLLSPLEELCGYHYGFVYLLRVDEQTVKIGFSEHPVRRVRELQPAFASRLGLRACFVGEPSAERFAHRRFSHLRVRNELFLAHSAIERYFADARTRMREQMKTIHICTESCRPINRRLDVRMLGVWLGR